MLKNAPFGLNGPLVTAVVAASCLGSGVALGQQPQQRFESSHTFQAAFITGAYAGAFGAALGAALLPFVPNPAIGNLRFIAGGASIGFIVGSVFEFSRRVREEADLYGDAVAERVSSGSAPRALLVRDATGFSVATPDIATDFRTARVSVLDLRF